MDTLNVKTFIDRLNLCCQEKGLTRTAWARDFGIPESTIRNWGRLKILPPSDVLFNIAKYFGVPMEYMIDGKEYPVDDDTFIMLLKFQKLPAKKKRLLIDIADSVLNSDLR